MSRTTPLRRVAPTAPPSDLNPTLTVISTALANGLTWANMQALATDVSVTMPSATSITSLPGTWTVRKAVSYTKDATGRVWLSGIITGGTYGTTTLASVPVPANASPGFPLTLPVAQSSLFEPAGVITIDSDGNLAAPEVTSVQSGVSTYLSLDGASYMAADPTPTAPGSPFPISLAINVPGGAPKSVIVLSCSDTTNRAIVPAAPPAITWDVSIANGRPVFRITNLTGLLPGRSYRVRFVVLAF